MENNYLLAFIFSAIAGLSTVIGGFVTFFIKENIYRLYTKNMSQNCAMCDIIYTVT